MITPERQVTFDKFNSSQGPDRVKLAKEFTKSQLNFLLRQIDDKEISPETIATALRDVAALITSPPGTKIIYGGKVP